MKADKTRERWTKKRSKFLSLVLRHQPESIGIELDSAGWTSISDLLQKSSAAGRSMTRDELQRIVDTNDKKRFAISADGKRIRASQGHSIAVELGYEPTKPPDILLHGTAPKALDLILAEGLKSMARHHVHLSEDHATATKVGQRRGAPVILKVDAKKMFEAGREFYRSDNGVWLTDEVPPQFLSRDHGPTGCR